MKYTDKDVKIDILKMMTEASFHLASAMLDFEHTDEVKENVNKAISHLDGVLDFLADIKEEDSKSDADEKRLYGVDYER